MKNLLLVAALGVAGLVSAKTSVTNPEKLNIYKIQGIKNFGSLKQEIKTKSLSAIDHQWFAIDSGCGQRYFLDLNQYSDDLAGLIAFQNDIKYFSDQECKGT